MRPLLAILITVLLFGGVFAYTTFVDSIRKPPLEIVEDFATDEYALHVSRTFDCEGDVDFEIPALLIMFRGKEIFVSKEKLASTERVLISPLENVVQSSNEIYIAASSAAGPSPPESAGGDAWGDSWSQQSGESSTDDSWGDDWSSDSAAMQNEGQPGAELQPDTPNIKDGNTELVLGAIRVRVRRGDETIVDQTLWQSSPGESIRGTISFAATVETADGHEHP